MHGIGVNTDVESAIFKQIKRFGGSVPTRSPKPTLAPGLVLFLSAFYDLDTERDLTNLVPIPWGAIRLYGEYYGFSAHEMDDLFYFVRECDNAYLKELGKQRGRR